MTNTIISIFIGLILILYTFTTIDSVNQINKKLDKYEQKLEEMHLILNNADTCQE